jgi:hypothetical protein
LGNRIRPQPLALRPSWIIHLGVPMASFTVRRIISFNTQPFRSGVLAKRLILTSGVFLLGFPSTTPADSLGFRRLTLPGSAQTSSNSPPTEADCQLALFARDALLQDEFLAPFNIGVSVRSGVATLWGTVPSPALARRAEERVRIVPGLAQVKNDLRTSTHDEELADFLKGTPPDASQSLQEAKRWDHTVPLVSREDAGRQSRLNANKAGPPLLMPAINIPAGPTQTVSSFEPTPNPKLAPIPLLVETLEHMRKNNERFRGIRIEVQGGVVRLWSNAANRGDAFTLAQQIAHVPGVERVIVEQNR